MKANLGTVLVVALVAVACGPKHPKAPTPATPLPTASVSTVKVEATKQPAIEEVVGTLRPKLQAVIEAKLSGRVAKLPVSLGQSVRQGDLLVELATQEIRARLEQAEATLAQAQIEFNRVAKLRPQGAATGAEFDAAQARLNVARANLAEAQAVAAYATITAPFDGVIARKFADEGDLAMPGKPLVELEGRAGLRCVADVPVELAGGLKPGAELTVRIETLAGPVTGTLAEISPAADPASRTVPVKVTLPAAEGLRAGQFARLAVPVGETTSLRVPPAALVIRGQLEVVFVVADGRAQMRLVRAGKRSAQGVEILAGLTSGETVVVDGAAALLDGQPVQVR